MPLNTTPLPGISDAAASSAHLTPFHLLAFTLAIFALIISQLDLGITDEGTASSALGRLIIESGAGDMAQLASFLLILALLGYYAVVKAWTAYDADLTMRASRSREAARLDLTGRTEMKKQKDAWVGFFPNIWSRNRVDQLSDA
jgi:SNF family Na+-dependent transporter